MDCGELRMCCSALVWSSSGGARCLRLPPRSGMRMAQHRQPVLRHAC